MSSTLQPPQAAQRARQYWYVDGLNEMAFGLVCTALALYFWGQASLSPESTLFKLLDMGFVLILIGAALGGARLVEIIKRRLTYPRTGFVSYRKPAGWQRILLAGLSAGSAMLLAGLMASSPAIISWMAAVSGLAIGGAWLFAAVKIGLLRFYLLAIASGLAGLIPTLLAIENIPGLAIYYAIMALLFFLSGGVTFGRYLQTPLVNQEETA